MHFFQVLFLGPHAMCRHIPAILFCLQQNIFFWNTFLDCTSGSILNVIIQYDQIFHFFHVGYYYDENDAVRNL